MSSPAVDRRLLRPATAAALLATLTIAACGAARGPSAGSTENAATTERAATAVASPGTPSVVNKGVETPTAVLELAANDSAPVGEVSGEEAPPERVHGRWRVIEAAGADSGKAMIGRALSFTDEALGWVDADGKVAGECRDPFFHVVSDATEVRNFSPAIKAGWAKFQLLPKQVGPLHAWECGDGEVVFGPREPAAGSVFYPIGTDRLVMNWLGGTVLLLRRQ